MKKFYICEDGAKCCVTQCILFIDAPIDIRNFHECVQSNIIVTWRSATAAEIEEVKNTSTNKQSTPCCVVCGHELDLVCANKMCDNSPYV